MVSAKECPNCRRLHPDTAPHCQCGYDFESGLVKQLQFDYRQISEAEIEEELKGFNERKPGALVGLLISVLVFLGTGMFGRDATAVLVIVFVVLIHELGHAFGMKLYGYRNVHMLFIPLMGAVTSGTPKNPSNAQKAVVSLLGPLPGLLLGGLFWVLFSTTRVELCGQIGRTFLFLNLFNLLPLAPLDGEKFFEHLLFARHAKLELAFKILTTFLVGLVAFRLKSPLLGILAVLGILTLKRQYLNASLAQRLRRELGSATSSEGDIPREILTSAKVELEQQFSERERTPKIIARNILDVWQRANSRAPSVKATLGLLSLYFGTFFIVGFVAVVWTVANIRASTVRKVETATIDGELQQVELIYQMGKLLSRTSLDGKVYHGLCEIYYPDTGAARIRGYWDRGKWDSEWSYYDKKGNVYGVVKLQKGHFVSERLFNQYEWVKITSESLPERLQRAFQNHEYGKPEGPTDTLRMRPLPPTPPLYFSVTSHRSPI
jgi:Zn-dependent protease